jgi:hypothetical protein
MNSQDAKEGAMGTISKTVVATEVGPAELAAGVVYVHDVELDEDVTLRPGQRVEIRDGAGRLRAATVASRHGSRWRLVIEP